jgi:hypothetical protein
MARMSEVENGRREMSMLRMKSSTLQFLAQTMILLFWSAMAAWASEPTGPSPTADARHEAERSGP